MEAFSLPTPQSTASSATPALPQSRVLPSQTPLQRRFQTLLEGARERWIYAIYWESSYDHSSAASLLCWGDGYYNFQDINRTARKTTSSAEQTQRKNFLRLLYSLIYGSSASVDDCDEDVTDPEWFFLMSMDQTFVNGSGLVGQTFFKSSPVWITGSDRLTEMACQRARQLQESGFQTVVCIPCPNGVVELASTEVILPNPDLMIKARDLIYFNCSVAYLTSSEIIQPREDKTLDERARFNMENHENDNLSKQSRGKEKKSDSKCSWFLLSESSDEGSDSTFSHSYDYSGPS